MSNRLLNTVEIAQLRELVQPLVTAGALPPLVARQRGGFQQILAVADAAEGNGHVRNGSLGHVAEVLWQIDGIDGDNDRFAARIEAVVLGRMRTATAAIRQLLAPPTNGTGADGAEHADGQVNGLAGRLDATLPADVSDALLPVQGAVVPAALPVHAAPRRRAADRLAELLGEEVESEILSPEEISLARELGLEVAGDPRMETAWKNVLRYAATPMIMLVRGQPGAGKEPFAQAIHKIRQQRGLTKQEEMVVANAAAINDSLIESELFGHKKGAFTGAAEARRGKFEEANDGTIFLDEIGDMPLGQQAKLLRVLENKTVQPVGENRSVKVNAKMVFATNRPLEEMKAAGQFRSDLLGRLKACQIVLPAWSDRTGRHRRAVADFLLARIGANYGAKHALSLSDDALLVLLETHFPSNVREVRDVLERSYVLAAEGAADGPLAIQDDHLRQALAQDDVDLGTPTGMNRYGPIEYGRLVRDGEEHLLPVVLRLPLEGGIAEMKRRLMQVLSAQVFNHVAGRHVGRTAKFVGVSRRSTTEHLKSFRQNSGGAVGDIPDDATLDGEEDESA
jgi:transcriptional regulator with GAF, ATPase, and Fis domain